MMTRITSLVLLLPLSAMASSMIETRDADGTSSRMYFEGDKARMEMPEQQGYMVMDIKNRSMKAVIPEQRMIMDMSELMKDGASKPVKQANSQLKAKGSGPKIAGYATKEYEIYANGKYCGSAFVSMDAMNDLGLKKFARAMQTIGSQVEEKFNQMSGMNADQFIEPCDHAERYLDDRVLEIGMPLRSTDSNKRMTSEVSAVSKNAKLPANAFVIPADYQVTNPNKMMQDAMKQMPNMQQMMKNMPPEAMEMMRQRMQEMQKMYQQ